MPSIETRQGSQYYTDHRREGMTQPPLLLIHGAGDTHLAWAIAIRKLNSIAVDLNGHGKSHGDGRTTISDYAADIIALMDALNLKQAIIGGHSMGGAIAMTLALTHAERVRGLVLIGTGAKLSVHSDILSKITTAQAEVGELLKTWLWSKATPQEMRDLGYTAFMQLRASVIYGDYLACNAFDLRTRLAEIAQPALVIGGTEDMMTPLRYSEYLAAHLPNAELVTLAGGGHQMGLEQPQVVAAAVAGWVKATFESRPS
jgi:pimeloyl-ACP methyl ester carboxylesterase